jgi:hypothetical protein
MGEVTPLPSAGDVFFDVRDEGRSLRVSWHAELGTVAVSFWRDDTCVSSFWLSPEDVPRLISGLVQPLVTQAARRGNTGTAVG